MTTPAPRQRLAPARLTEQFVLMEEGAMADKIKATADILGISYAEVIRRSIRDGGIDGVIKTNAIGKDTLASGVLDTKARRLTPNIE